MSMRVCSGWRPGPGAVFLVLLVVTAAGISAPQDPTPARYEAPDGLFSYVPPAGWRLAESPVSRYRIAAAPPSGGFAANINVLYETRPGVSLERTVEINLAGMRRQMSGFELIERSEFVTDSGDRSIKVVGEFTDSPGRLRSSWYFFDAGDRKLIVTCSRLASQPGELDATFDRTLKSFRVGG